ncbi:hypothetical protein HDU99_004210 [Rhizoclosmatium hyalinum]|nr:hypothetical protein HDU99_004210 [Rhizoclosmatium hyalinum]
MNPLEQTLQGKQAPSQVQAIQTSQTSETSQTFQTPKTSIAPKALEVPEIKIPDLDQIPEYRFHHKRPVINTQEVVGKSLDLLADGADPALVSLGLAFGYTGTTDVPTNLLYDFVPVFFAMHATLCYVFLEWFGKQIDLQSEEDNRLVEYFRSCFLVDCQDGIAVAATHLAEGMSNSKCPRPLVLNWESLAKLTPDEVVAIIYSFAFIDRHKLQWEFCIAYVKAKEGILDISLEGGSDDLHITESLQNLLNPIFYDFVPGMIERVTQHQYETFVVPYIGLLDNQHGLEEWMRRPQTVDWKFGLGWRG